MTSEPVVQYLELSPDEPSQWPARWLLLSRLANVCQLSELAGEPEGQEWRDKAAVYRQHAVKLARRMGWKVPVTCGYCKKSTNYKEVTDLTNYHSTQIVLNRCGHSHHSLCQAKAKQLGGTTCATCQQLSRQGDMPKPGICRGPFGQGMDAV